jgi:hypothetical protein
MNASQLHDCFLGSLQADPTIRKQAESQLNQFSHSVGFLAACLDILSNENVQPIVKQSCSIYFKNIILKNWTIGNLIDNDERPIIRERLLISITNLDKIFRNQLLPALSLIIKYDYPNSWNDLLDHILNLINNSNDDINSLYVGIYSFTELCRNFRWKNNMDRSTSLDPIIMNFFPSLLNIGKQLINDSKFINSFEASEILKLIIKCYKFVTYIDFPQTLQENQSLIDWITFHVQVLNININQDSLAGWNKSQKWSYHNLYRLFQRYGTKTLSSKFNYDEFRINFKNNILPQLINVYIENLKGWINNSKYLSDNCLYYLLQLFEQALLKKDTFKLIESHFNFIIVDVATKIFLPKDEDLELYEDEPEEYIHKIFEIIDENTGEDSLHSFLFTLVEKRVDYLIPMFQFIVQKFNELNNQQETIEIAKNKESLMKFLSPISYKLSQNKNPVFNEVEPFLNNFIIPNFESNFPFIRARTCNLLSKFDNLAIQQSITIENLFKGIISCFLNDSNGLPIQIQGALAIQSFIINEDFKKLLQDLILQLMEKLMNLSNKFDSDILPAVMQELVESFPEKLEPFADQLMEQLSMKLITLLKSINDLANSNVEDYDELENLASDKTSTALGILNTMITILLYFENSTEIIDKLEVSYSQVIKLIFEEKIEDFYAEAGELIENTLFLTRKVSPIMWSLLNSFINCLFNDDDITLYLEDSLPALKNYLIFGSETIQNNVELQNLYYKIILTVFQIDFDDGDIGFNDINNISDLCTTFILSLNVNSSSNYLPTLINYSIKNLIEVEKQLKSKGKSHKIVLLNNIISSLIINPNVTMKALIESNQLEYFLTQWFETNAQLKRVFDLKLSILGYISLLSIDLGSLNSMMLTNILSPCGDNVSKLFMTIPQAIKDLEKKRAEYTDKSWENELTYNINQVGDDDDDEHGQRLGNEEEDNDEDDDNDEEDYSHLFSGDKKFNFNHSDDELDEDPYSNSSLDKINIFSQFQTFIVNMQNTESEKYNLVFGGLSNDDKQTLASILNSI